MLKIIHRVNRTEELKNVPREYGVEIDVRGYGERMLLSHDPLTGTGGFDDLEEYITHYNHRFIIFNVKEAGYEDAIIDLAERYGINDYFLLDVEFPYIYRASRQEGFRKIAVRYSEAEPIEYAEAQAEDGRPLLDWVWIDTNTRLPLDREIVKRLKPFKTCLVCPERWGRPEDIPVYRRIMKDLDFEPDAVMSSIECVKLWEEELSEF